MFSETMPLGQKATYKLAAVEGLSCQDPPVLGALGKHFTKAECSNRLPNTRRVGGWRVQDPDPEGCLCSEPDLCFKEAPPPPPQLCKITDGLTGSLSNEGNKYLSAYWLFRGTFS